jgi:16S rRNA (uracil1498-N3)-methyltransferase
MTPRLLLTGPLAADAIHDVAAEQSHYLLRVLRLREGDALEVFDGDGARHAASIVRVDGQRCTLKLGPRQPSATESPLRITLAQCLSSAEKMDWTIEKAVELGAAGIVPLQSQRSVVRLDAERARRRAEHWQRLIAAACMQCGRDRLPVLAAVEPLPQWLRHPPAHRLRLVLAPGADARLGGVRLDGDADRAPAEATVLVGPESGLSEAELAAAVNAGFRPVSLGPRVLRTETAGLAAIAVLQSRFGDL